MLMMRSMVKCDRFAGAALAFNSCN
jgi:hypothetical protein